ncbi:MAG: hypothetical protein IJZ44_00735 [Lachnospiraceae bacterium]|nr:hypothetical protein [Lachnospiraceae bacterium]
MITCKECGGKFEEKEAACPYCGALNYAGAEEQYMHNLESMRSDMANMGDDSKEAYATSAKKSSIVIITTFSVLLLIAGIIVAIFLICQTIMTASEDEDLVKSQMLWREQYLDDLDTMYEAGQYDEIVTFMDKHAEDEGYSIYSWEHCDFIQVYRSYAMFHANAHQWDSFDLTMKKWTLYDAVSIECYLSTDIYMFTEEERVMIEGWCEEIKAFYHDELGLSDEEISEMRDFVISNSTTNLPESKLCKQYLTEVLGYTE